jgi:hypothetical protein
MSPKYYLFPHTDEGRRGEAFSEYLLDMVFPYVCRRHNNQCIILTVPRYVLHLCSELSKMDEILEIFKDINLSRLVNFGGNLVRNYGSLQAGGFVLWS